jgi:hypothetical protein
MLPALLALTLAVAPAADLNTLFANTLGGVKAKTSVPILLPDTLPTDVAPLYASGSGHRTHWELSLAGAPDCGGANACFIADFRGKRGGDPVGRGEATLTGGHHGRYQPLSCGASCSPPSIAWKMNGSTYTIQANVVGPKGSTDRQLLVRMANEAIRRGPR